MIGTLSVEVKAVRPFAIHGDLYYEIHVPNPDAPMQLIGLRIPQHATDAAPRDGDKLELTFLMGQITQARRQPS
jgi:hypothetical protein